MVASGASLYAGAALAVGLFEQFPPAIVAWMRMSAAAVILVVLLRPKLSEFISTSGRLAGLFGLVTLGMNMVFYEAIARLPMGTAVAIEFLGPIAVAALGSRSGRDWLALILAATGVLTLSGAQWSSSASGVLFALGAAVLWAFYIVLGDKVSRDAVAPEPVTGGLSVEEDFQLSGQLAEQPAQQSSKRTGLAVGFGWAAVLSAPLVGLGLYAAEQAGVASINTTMAPMIIVGLAIGLGTLSAVIPYSLDQVVLAGPAYFALLLALLPLVAAIAGAIVLGQMLTAVEVVGIAAVVAAVAVRKPGESAAAGLEDGEKSNAGDRAQS